MYTAKIIEKKIHIQEEFLLLKVQLMSNVGITPVEDPNKEKKLDKNGEPKLSRIKKERFPTTNVLFKFPLPTTKAIVKKAIQDKAKMIADIEALDLPMNVDIK